MIPGEIRVRETPLELNAQREKRRTTIVNKGDRPVQVGSHLHLAHANPALEFDRDGATGFRLDIPAGTSVRFEPGVSRTVGLVALGGHRYVAGLRIAGDRPESRRHEPKPFVPFGTPGAESEQAGRALAAPARVSDEAATDAHTSDTEDAQREQGES